MTNSQRLKVLEKKLNPDPGRVYVMIDNQGVYWVNGQAYSEAEFNDQFKGRPVNAVRVGFDISKV